MDNFKNIAVKLALLFVFIASVNTVHAAPGDLAVDFESTPLFNEVSFMPSGEVVKWVKVANNTSDSHIIIVEAINKINSDGLGDFLNLKIKEGGTILYNDSLADFLNGGEVVLSNLSSNANTSYDFIVNFNSAANNNYQEKNLGFDLLIGFQGQGGEQTNDSGFSVSSGSSSSFDGGGGSGGSYQGLLISNDSSPQVIGNDAAITWNTSYYSTSQVIFGPASGAPYNLNIALPNFGYASSSPDFLDKVINHSVTIYGLPPGNYLYRVVSHASPPTISFEHSFIISSASGAAVSANVYTQSENQNGQNNAKVSKRTANKNIVPAINNEKAAVFEENISNDVAASGAEKISVKDIISGQENISKNPDTNNLAAVLFVFDKISGSLKYILLFLFIVGIVWFFFIRKKE
ncbi:MAG: protein of unknown function with transrane region [Parcubacteria group bacterium]|nr:protein of unknown function with transrane region [Parcubacteria group bacterium]